MSEPRDFNPGDEVCFYIPGNTGLYKGKAVLMKDWQGLHKIHVTHRRDSVEDEWSDAPGYPQLSNGDYILTVADPGPTQKEGDSED